MVLDWKIKNRTHHFLPPSPSFCFSSLSLSFSCHFSLSPHWLTNCYVLGTEWGTIRKIKASVLFASGLGIMSTINQALEIKLKSSLSHSVKQSCARGPEGWWLPIQPGRFCVYVLPCLCVVCYIVCCPSIHLFWLYVSVNSLWLACCCLLFPSFSFLSKSEILFFTLQGPHKDC